MSFDVYPEYGILPKMRHKHFSQFWGNDVDAFLADCKASGIPLKISDDNTKTLYWLLLAEFANSTIANADENQFKNRLNATIFRYGPTWEKRLEIQEKIRALTDDEIGTGVKRQIRRVLVVQRVIGVHERRTCFLNNLACVLEREKLALTMNHIRAPADDFIQIFMFEVVQRHADTGINLEGNGAHVVDLIFIIAVIVVVV